MAVKLSPETLRAVQRYGRTVSHIAKRYGLSGEALLGKLVLGESGDRKAAVSNKGARGKGQFMPGSRDVARRKYGIDPWKSTDEAVHAMALHLRGKINGRSGLEGYNPGGGQAYVDQMLATKVGDVRGSSSRAGGTSAPSVRSQTEIVRRPSFKPAQVKEDVDTAILDQLLAGDHKRGQLMKGVMRRLDSGMYTTTVPAEYTPGKTRERRAPVPTIGSESGGGAGKTFRGAKGKLIGTPHSGTHTLGNWQSDNAVDLGAKEGTIIQVPMDAVVEKVGGSYKGGASRFDGYQVTVRFKDGRRAFFTHLSKTHVKKGMKLRAGQAIGRVGSANGVPHLHVGLEKGDPRKVFK